MIQTGSMVRFKSYTQPPVERLTDICTVIEVKFIKTPGWAQGENMARVLHPTGTTSWEFINYLERVT